LNQRHAHRHLFAEFIEVQQQTEKLEQNEEKSMIRDKVQDSYDQHFADHDDMLKPEHDEI
jgi:hypothetical protein